MKRSGSTEDFLRWPDIYSSWQAEIDRQSVTVDPLFSTVEVDADPDRTDDWVEDTRNTSITWWEPDLIDANTRQLQINLDGGPRLNTIPAYKPSSAAWGTLRRLWPIRDNPEQVAALLIFASVYSRTHQHHLHRRDYPSGNWPPFNEVKRLQEVVGAVLDAHHIWPGWHPSVRDPLPYHCPDHGEALGDVPSVLRYIAAEHAEMLRQHRPVAIKRVLGLRKTRKPGVVQA